MVIFIFTYNYLHEFDEMAAVCSSVFFRKAMLKTCFSSRPWHSVCVGDLSIGLMTFSLPQFFIHNILWLSIVNLLSSFSLLSPP